MRVLFLFIGLCCACNALESLKAELKEVSDNAVQVKQQKRNDLVLGELRRTAKDGNTNMRIALYSIMDDNKDHASFAQSFQKQWNEQYDVKVECDAAWCTWNWTE